MKTEIILMTTQHSEDCGCPEEHYLINGVDLEIHFDKTGEVDAFMDGGDWGEAFKTVRGASPDVARIEVLAWALVLTSIPNES